MAWVNEVKRKLYRGEPAYGIFVMEFATPGIAKILEQAGADFAVFDMEHSGFDIGTVKSLMSYCRGVGILPIVRVPRAEYHFMARVLDLGARGIMVPQVDTRSQAEMVARSCKYPPLGARGLALGNAHDDYAGGPAAEKIRNANDETLVIVQIESQEAVENVNEIVSVDGIDCAWMGHGDLSVSMGIPGQTEHPDIHAAMMQVQGACTEQGKIAGRQTAGAAEARVWLEKGFTFLSVGSDIRIFQRAVANELALLRGHQA